jgi:beta-lactamase class A
METALTREYGARRSPAGAAAWLAAAFLAATQAGTVLAAPEPPHAPVAAQAGPARDAAGPTETRRALFAKLRQRIEAVDARLDGVLGVCVVDLAGGERIELRPDDAFPTASSIKLAILYELYRQAEEGRVDLAEVTRPAASRVRGGGVLQELGDRVSLTWRDVAVLMIGWSDNEATNLLMRRLGMDAVNRRLDALSLPRTRLRRQMMDLEAARRGEENVSTPCELARLAALVARGDGLPPERGRDLLAVATVADEGSYFRRGLPEGQRAVSKPGSLEGVRCEAAWVDVPGRPYAAAVMTSYLRHDADGEAAIREISAALYEAFDRLARSSAYGRAIGPR